MQIHVCGQRGVWSTVDVPEGEILELRETLRDLEDNTQAIRIQVGGECPSNDLPATEPAAEEAVEPDEPEPEAEAPKSKRKKAVATE